MQAIGQNHIDYWQRPHPAQRGLQNRFGVRVRDGRCWALIQIGDEDPFTFGKAHDIPVDLSMLPSYLRMIVDDHLLNDPNSDLVEVLGCRKSFVEPKQMSLSGSVWLPHAS